MNFRASSALLVSLALAACTAAEAPKTDPAKAAEQPAKAAEQPPTKVEQPAKAEAPTLPLEPSADIKYDPPFDGKALTSTKTPSGLTVEDFVVGDGPEAVNGGEVEVHYTGYLTDGTIFDTSKKRNRTFTFELGQGRVIKGWDEGVAGMKVGGKRRLIVPAALGYGDRRAGKIPPGATLVFTIELIGFTPPLPPPQPLTAFDAKPLSSKKLEDGLMVHEFKVGEGAEAKAGDVVAVHYRGTLKADGTEFDSSLTRKPITFPLGQGRVIKGWDLGIAGMKVGGLRKLEIPAKLAYGERARGKIPANADLVFTVELMAVKAPPTPPSTVTPTAEVTKTGGTAPAGDAAKTGGTAPAGDAAKTGGTAPAAKTGGAESKAQ